MPARRSRFSRHRLLPLLHSLIQRQHLQPRRRRPNPRHRHSRLLLLPPIRLQTDKRRSTATSNRGCKCLLPRRQRSVGAGDRLGAGSRPGRVDQQADVAIHGTGVGGRGGMRCEVRGDDGRGEGELRGGGNPDGQYAGLGEPVRTREGVGAVIGDAAVGEGRRECTLGIGSGCRRQSAVISCEIARNRRNKIHAQKSMD